MHPAILSFDTACTRVILHFSRSFSRMYRLLRQSKRVPNYRLACRSISSVKHIRPIIKPLVQPSSAALQQLQRNRMVFINTKRHATTTASYKQTPFLNWKLFPDFEHLLTQTKPDIAVPAFQKLIAAAKEQFIELEKSFEPTWEGTIGKRKYFANIKTTLN